MVAGCARGGLGTGKGQQNPQEGHRRRRPCQTSGVPEGMRTWRLTSVARGQGTVDGDTPRLEAGLGKLNVRNFREGAGNVTRGAGLRPAAKAVDMPPDPTVGAPALYPAGPAVRQCLRQHGRQGRHDNGAHQSARPERRLYVKAKAEKDWRFWGLYVHVGKLETLRAAYVVAKQNDGAPGSDGVTFEAIEAAGVEPFLAQLRDELVARTYRPLRNRRVEIPEGRRDEFRVLGIPADPGPGGPRGAHTHPGADLRSGLSRRVVRLSPEADSRSGGGRVAEAIVREQDAGDRLDLAAYFDSVRHDRLLAKVARRIRTTETSCTC